MYKHGSILAKPTDPCLESSWSASGTSVVGHHHHQPLVPSPSPTSTNPPDYRLTHEDKDRALGDATQTCPRIQERVPDNARMSGLDVESSVGRGLLHRSPHQRSLGWRCRPPSHPLALPQCSTKTADRYFVDLNLVAYPGHFPMALS